jgi:hypothetical protein
MTRSLLLLFFISACMHPTRAANDPVAFLAGNVGAFIMPKFETIDLSLDQGFMLGFGGSLGVRVVNTIYVTTSITYLRRTGTKSLYSWYPNPYQMHRNEVQEKYGEVRIDIGPLLRTELAPLLWLNPEFGATYLGLSLGRTTSVDNGTAFWGGYVGIGIEHRPAEIASMCIAVKYRHLQKQSADFGGLQIQLGLRFLISSQE